MSNRSIVISSLSFRDSCPGPPTLFDSDVYTSRITRDIMPDPDLDSLSQTTSSPTPLFSSRSGPDQVRKSRVRREPLLRELICRTARSHAIRFPGKIDDFSNAFRDSCEGIPSKDHNALRLETLLMNLYSFAKKAGVAVSLDGVIGGGQTRWPSLPTGGQCPGKLLKSRISPRHADNWVSDSLY